MYFDAKFEICAKLGTRCLSQTVAAVDDLFSGDEKSSEDDEEETDGEAASSSPVPSGLVKRDALKRYQLLEMPRVLTVHLKRFVLAFVFYDSFVVLSCSVVKSETNMD